MLYLKRNMENKKIPKLYLDQNIIDYLIKGNLKFNEEMNHFQIVYSMITLKEFARIADESKRNLYLDFFKNNNAQYFWVDNNEYAHFENICPYVVYNKVITENLPFVGIEKSMQNMMHKFIGGKKDYSYEDIIDEQKNSFNELINFLKKEIESLGEAFPYSMNIVDNYADILNTVFSNLLDKNLNIINNHPDKINKLSEFRKKLSIAPSELNNIQPPNIVIKVWEKIEKNIKKFSDDVKFDDLFGDGIGRYFPNQKLTMTMKVNSIFNMLNFFGYYADKEIEKDRNFISNICDQQHAGLAIYANVFITRDKRMMKKTRATYELLNISTDVQFIEA